MKKTLFILAIVLCGTGILFAQKPMRGIVIGADFVGIPISSDAPDLVDASFGMPVAGTTLGTGHSVTSGLPFAHLQKVNEEAVVMVGEDYVDDYFSFTPVQAEDGLPENNPHRSYKTQPSPRKYDILATLDLTVILCGPSVTADYEGGNSYESVFLAGYCWTKSNLKEEVTGARVYDDKTEADADFINFINKYGRLYTWYQAVDVAQGATPTPDPTTGFVKGICPEGWHIPTGDEMNALRSVPAPDINATTDWTGSHASENNNETGFTAYPAGFYKAALNRYEGLGTQTDWWSDVFTSNANIVTATVTEIAYYCDAPMEKQYDATNAMSVRCVKDNDGPILVPHVE
jgi:uncharacterized protein (TIGR02145 family)